MGSDDGLGWSRGVEGSGRRGTRGGGRASTGEAPRGFLEVLLEEVHVALRGGEVLVARHALDHVHRDAAAQPERDRVVPQAVDRPALEAGALARPLERLIEPVLPPALPVLVQGEERITGPLLHRAEEARKRRGDRDLALTRLRGVDLAV